MATIPDVLSCTINRSKNVSTYASSSTAGGTKSVDGTQDVTIEMEVAAQANTVPFSFPGIKGTLSINQQASGALHTGGAMCISLRVSIPVENGDRVTHAYTFGCTSAWADLTAGGGADGPYSSKNALFDWTPAP